MEIKYVIAHLTYLHQVKIIKASADDAAASAVILHK